MPPSPTPLQQVRRQHLSRVLRVVAARPGVSQSELPALAELAVGAISSIINELLDRELLVAESRSDGRRGRPARLLRLSDHRADLVAVDVTRDRIEARAHTLAGRELARRAVPLDGPPTPAVASAILADAVAAVAADAGASNGRTCIAVSVPGRVLGGRIESTALAWDGIPEAELAGRLRIAEPADVLVGNDGSFAALAESRSGVVDATGNLVVLLLERGLGGSATVHGELVAGHRKPAGWGHIPLHPGGRPCDCGLHGCAERYLSIDAIADELGERAELDAAPIDGYVEQLVRRAGDGEPRVLDALADARIRFGELADVLAAAFDPDAVVLTGTGAALAEWVMPSAAGGIRAPVLRGIGAEAPIAGALLAAQNLYFDELPA